MRKLACILFLLPMLLQAAPLNRSLEEVLLELDTYIEKKDVYVQDKQARIRALQDELKKGDLKREYDLNYDLFKEYQSFMYDSAYFYANRSLEHARKIGCPDKIVQSRCALVFCYLSSGLFLEAFDEIKEIDAWGGVSDYVRSEYFALYNRLCYDASDFNNTESCSLEYTRLGTVYADSLMAITPEDSFKYIFTQAQREIKHWHYRESIPIYQKLLNGYGASEHDKAIINSSIGAAYKALGQIDSSMIYMARAAINDIVSATKETTALYRLAEMLCEIKEYDRSYTYIHMALADADFYNARHRKLSINPILPIIEQAQLEIMTRQRNLMALIMVMCVFIVILIAVAYMLFRRQHRQLIRKRSQLIEANRIKDEYIGHTFYINSEFISEFEELYKTISQKIAARQYDDLRDLSRLSKINKKRESMYESFDKCFIRIFPSFISEYASLFPEGMIDPNATELTSEMRIFALIRLGITDSERISKFLNYSVHTIYTYKTRAKTKSIVGNDEFEKRIKNVEIG